MELGCIKCCTPNLFKDNWEESAESLHLMVKIARRLNDNMTLVSETSHKQNHCDAK